MTPSVGSVTPPDPTHRTALRVGEDRCPGALRPFRADDGLIVRVRIPGGEISIAALRTLAGIGRDYGNPHVQLTTRANLQVRGLPDPLPAGVADRIADAGLLPSLTHERARNILAAPTGRASRARAGELDKRLRERKALAALPGRFLMLLSDVSGLGLGEPFDVAYVEHGDGSGLLLVDSARSTRAAGTERGVLGRPCAADEAVDALLDLAERFLAARADERAWNIRDLPADTPLLDDFGPVTVTAPDPLVPGPVAGVRPTADLVVGVPLGLLTPEHLDVIAAVTDRLVVTPWRSLLLEGAAPYADQLSAAGLVTNPRSAWNRISACSGAPYCARAHTETLSLARACVAALPIDGPRLHLVGCERVCGRPRLEHRAVVAAETIADVLAVASPAPVGRFGRMMDE